MKETMYSGEHVTEGNVIFCVRGDKVVYSHNSGPYDPWRTPEGFIGFTYWGNDTYIPEHYSNVELIWERDV